MTLGRAHTCKAARKFSTLFVLKSVSRSIFDHSQEFKNEFGTNPHLRTHVDCNSQSDVLIYEYFKSDLLSLVGNYPPPPSRSKKDNPKRGWIGTERYAYEELDIPRCKPNNVFLNWHVDEKDQFQLGKVVLGDLDCVLKLQGHKLLSQRIGNVMWCSPEGQLGKSVGKPSEVFSFGLLCLYVLTGVQCFHPDFDQLKKDGTEPEFVILFKLLSVFGPLLAALVNHVHDEEAGALLEGLWNAIAEDKTNENFGHWSEETFPNLSDEAKRLILRMTNLDPAKRAPMSGIVEDRYWG